MKGNCENIQIMYISQTKYGGNLFCATQGNYVHVRIISLRCFKEQIGYSAGERKLIARGERNGSGIYDRKS